MRTQLPFHPLKRLIHRFFPKKDASPCLESEEWSRLTEGEKRELSLRHLSQGELALLQGNLSALSYFEAATKLDPQNSLLWHRQGLSFFEYGSEEGKEKALLLASKYFKIAAQLNPLSFETWVAWGNALLQLGRFHAEHHFLLEAKEKYEKAIALSESVSRETLGELYWDLGIAWMEIAQYSGEALDLRLSIEAFQISSAYQQRPAPEFLNDWGKAYLELGLLINDPRLYLQSIDTCLQAVAEAPHYLDGWASLAESYSQLYLNTLDERYLGKASESFSAAVKLAPAESDLWLSWAQILGESGRSSEDAKTLHLSIEKCARASALDPENALILAQWAESLSFLGLFTGRLDLLIEAEHKVLKATELFPDDPDVWHAYGLCCMAFGKYYEDPDYYELAIEKLQIGLSMDRTSAEHWHTLGLVHKLYASLVCHEDLLERANRFFERAIDFKPSHPALLFDAASSLLRFSEMSDDLPSLEKALALFHSLLQTCKEAALHHPEWLYEYGCALAWLADYSEEVLHIQQAIDLFSQVLLLDPDFPRVHFQIALCYVELGHAAEEPEFYKRALHFFRLSARQDEENEHIWLEWGLCLIHLAHHTLDTDTMHQCYWEAEQKITRAGSLGNPSAYYNLACLYSILGKTSEAMELIQKALSARALPPLEELAEDQWLDNMRATENFNRFINALETKLHTREE